MSELANIIARSDWSPRTKEEYTRCVSRWESFAGYDPAVWNARMVESWRDALRDSGLGRSSVNKHLYALRYASRRCETLGYCPDFARGAEAMRRGYGGEEASRKRRRALSVEEVSAILEVCRASSEPKGARDAAIVLLAVKTGLRAAALCRADWGGISGRVLTVREKGSRNAAAVLDDEVLAELELWGAALTAIGGSTTGRIFRGIGRPRMDGTHIVYRGLSRQALHRAVSSRAREAGIRRAVHPHLFRHTFVSWALDAGVPPERVMAATGHASLATVSRYFTDLQAESDPVSTYLPRLRKG